MNSRSLIIFLIFLVLFATSWNTYAQDMTLTIGVEDNYTCPEEAFGLFPVKVSTNIQLCFDVGVRAHLTCQGSQNAELQWYETYGGSHAFGNILTESATNYTLEMVLEDFDDKKIIYCTLANNHKVKSPTISLIKNSKAPVTDNINIKHCTNNEIVNFRCEYSTSIGSAQVGVIEPGKNTTTRNKPYTDYTFTKEKNGTILFCLYYEKTYSKVPTVSRHVVNKTMLIYDGEYYGDSLLNEGNKSPVIILASGIVSAIILLCGITLVVKKYCCQRRCKLTNMTNMDASANRVEYAELEFHLSSTTLNKEGETLKRRCEEECPYAEIIGTIHNVNKYKNP